MSVAEGVLEATRKIASLLESFQACYAVGGAVAMTLLRHVRATTDLDLLVLLPAVRWQEFAHALDSAGFCMQDDRGRSVPADVAEMDRSVRDLGHFRVWLHQTKVEIFVPKVPLQDEILRRRRRVDLEGFSLWITTVEDLILLKMIFHRPKDLEDVRHLLAANRDELDVAYIRSWIPRTLEDAVGDELLEMLRRTGIAI